eukprot:7742242-Ditylum_brightwellii.AAC.1
MVKNARKAEGNVFCKLQVAYTFSKFATNLEEAFTILRDYMEPILETEELHLLHEKIKTGNAIAEINVLVSTFFSIEHLGR